MYFYTVYHKIIKSDIELPQLIEAEETKNYHLWIKNEKLPQRVHHTIHATGGPAGEGEDFFWLNTPCGYVAIMKDDTIIAEYDGKGSLSELATYVLGYGLSFWFYQKNIMAIHCSAVERDGKAFLLMGYSGSGKSTLADCFLQKGYCLVADDIAVLEQKEETVWTYPAFPQRKLCRDAAIRQNYDINNLHYIDEEKDKFAVKCLDEFSKQASQVKALILIRPFEGEEVMLEEIKGSDKVQILFENLFLHIYLKNRGLPPEKFMVCLGLVSKLPMYLVKRPINGGDTTKKQFEFIEGI